MAEDVFFSCFIRKVEQKLYMIVSMASVIVYVKCTKVFNFCLRSFNVNRQKSVSACVREKNDKKKIDSMWKTGSAISKTTINVFKSVASMRSENFFQTSKKTIQFCISFKFQQLKYQNYRQNPKEMNLT